MTTLDNKAKEALERLIRKARVHFYKPIQVAEILYRDRVIGDINLLDLDTYRTKSKQWRDDICLKLTGRKSTSSSRYQDDLFNDNAIPPKILDQLGRINRNSHGGIEAFIYLAFSTRFTQLNKGVEYCTFHSKETFQVQELLSIFWHEPGLRRSIDKIYEIVVFALFSSITKAIRTEVTISLSPQGNLLALFEDFTERILGLSAQTPSRTLPARIFRVGVTNAADRGLDMWANFGLAIQIKHLSLTEELAHNIVTGISADRIIIVCKDSEHKLIVSLLNQLGWRSRIQSIVTESDLIRWYNTALREAMSDELANLILETLNNELVREFPTLEGKEFCELNNSRGYSMKLIPPEWLAH